MSNPINHSGGRRLNEREAGQREALQKRLAGRKRRPSREVFEDFGVPTLNEEERVDE